MKREQARISCVLLVCFTLSGCVMPANLENLSTQWSENFALAPYGSIANHPSLNDGNLETVGVVHPVKGERIFTLQFESTKKINKIVIHNDNLYRFNVDYLDTKTGEWKTVHEVRQRRNIGKERVNLKFVIDKLNFQTDEIRINVLRTVDDRVVSRTSVGPNDKVVNEVRGVKRGRYGVEYRILNPSIASAREIEVYHLAKK